MGDQEPLGWHTLSIILILEIDDILNINKR